MKKLTLALTSAALLAASVASFAAPSNSKAYTIGVANNTSHALIFSNDYEIYPHLGDALPVQATQEYQADYVAANGQTLHAYAFDTQDGKIWPGSIQIEDPHFKVTENNNDLMTVTTIK